MVHLYSGGPAQRVGIEEMDMLHRLSLHFGDCSKAAILRTAVRDMYDKHLPSMADKIKRLSYEKKK
jgi:hypothetical protein